MRAVIGRPLAGPLSLGRPGWSLVLVFVLVAIVLLAMSAPIPADSKRECGLAADVAAVVGGGPFYRDLEDEIIGEPKIDDSPWKANCLATFGQRGLSVLPVGALLFGPTRLGTRFTRPYFIDDRHATIDEEAFGGHGGATRTSVERHGNHWSILRRRKPDSWPPTL